MIDYSLFPRLTSQNHRITSAPSTDYNCIAWAAGDTQNWWQPGIHWPTPTQPIEESVEELKRLFQSLGYEEAADGNLDAACEKVALFGDVQGYTHAARQLSDGKWTSKLGNEEDIEHDAPDSVAGGIYGDVVLIMKRKPIPPI